MTTDLLRLSTNLQIQLISNLMMRSRVDDLLRAVVDRAKDELDADACSIYRVESQPDNKGPGNAIMCAAAGYATSLVGDARCKILHSRDVALDPKNDQKLRLPGWILSTGKPLLAASPEDIWQHPHWTGRYDSKQMLGRDIRLSAFLGVPLRDLHGKIIGALQAERLSASGRGQFSVTDQIALEVLARVAVSCIVYARDAEREDLNSAIIAWTLNLIGEAVATEGELDAFLDIVVRVTAAATQADSCAVFLIDNSKKTLTQRAGWGSQELRKVIRSYKLPERKQLINCESDTRCDPPRCAGKAKLQSRDKVGLTAWVAATGKSFHARNFSELRDHCHHLGSYDEHNFKKDEQCGAWLGVPLRVGGKIDGVLKIENVSTKSEKDNRDFDLEIQRRLDVLAEEIGLAIRRLQSQSPARFEVIHAAMPTIRSILQGDRTVPKLAELVVEETSKLFKARACALFLKEGEQLIQPAWAAFGWAQRGPRVRIYDLVEPDQIEASTSAKRKVGLTVWIAVRKEKFVAKSNLELISHPHHRGEFDEYNFEREEQCETFMGVPLVSGPEKQLIGVLKVETKMKDNGFAYFNEQDELVFELIADCAAIAIQNARLLEARKLTDKIVNNCQNATQVFLALHDFVSGRLDIVNTLEKTARQVATEDQTADRYKKKVVDLFKVLLLPGWRPDPLKEFVGIQSDPVIRSLLQLFVQAASVTNIDDINQLDFQQFGKRTNYQVGTPRFPLYEGALLFEKALDLVQESLRCYFGSPGAVRHLSLAAKALNELVPDAESMNHFEKHILKRIIEHWIELLDKEAKSWRPIANPYVLGLPLEPDSPVFIGRNETFSWIEQNLAKRTPLILHGGWHTGKTSILKQLEAGTWDNKHGVQGGKSLVAVFIDLQNLADPGEAALLYGIARAIRESMSARGIMEGVQWAPSIEERFEKRPYQAFNEFLYTVVDRVTEANGLLVIMLDEFEKLQDRVDSKKLDAEIFTYLRSHMQHEGRVNFLLAGRHSLDEMKPEFKQGLFNVALHHELGFLSSEEATQLIRNPVKNAGVEVAQKVVEIVLQLTAGHPFFVQQLCHEAINSLNREEKGRSVLERHIFSALDTALQRNSTLESYWTEVSRIEKIVLRQLAALLPEDSSWTCRDKLRIGRNVEVDVNHALERLVAQGLLRRRASTDRRSDEYRFNVNMFRRWVLKND